MKIWAGNSHHPTLDDARSAARHLNVIHYGPRGKKGAESGDDALRAWKYGETQDSFVTNVLSVFRIILVIAALGGNTGRKTVVEILKAILGQVDREGRRKIVPLVMLITPTTGDNSPLKRVKEADEVVKTIEDELGLACLKMATDVADTRGDQVDYTDFDRWIEIILDLFVTIFTELQIGLGIDGTRFGQLYKDCGVQTVTLTKFRVDEILDDARLQDRYKESWQNNYFTQHDLPVFGAIRIIRTPKLVGRINSAFARFDGMLQDAREIEKQRSLILYQLNGEPLNQDEVVVATLRFHEIKAGVARPQYRFALFEQDVKSEEQELDESARYKVMTAFASLEDWIGAFRAKNPAAIAEEPAEEMFALFTYEAVMKNLPALAEIGDLGNGQRGKGLPAKIHHKVKAVIQKNFKLTKSVFKIKDDPYYLQPDLVFDQLQKIPDFRDLTLTEELLAEVQTRIYFCRAVGDEIIQTLEVQDDAKAAAAVPAENTNGNQNRGDKRFIPQPIKNFVGWLAKDTDDRVELNLK